METPTIGGWPEGACGRPMKNPQSLAAELQSTTVNAAQATTDTRKSRERGKKEANTANSPLAGARGDQNMSDHRGIWTGCMLGLATAPQGDGGLPPPQKLNTVLTNILI